jgi:GNAT superfamily N-acetyltransferase
MIEFTEHSGEIDDRAIEAMWQLVQLCFDPDPSIVFADVVREKRRPVALLAWSGPVPVGFKLGYERTGDEFYSWLGGVHPEFRRRGIARHLLNLQHEWCQKSGYRRVSTETHNNSISMLALNLASGFLVVGVRNDNRGLEVLLERNFDNAVGGTEEMERTSPADRWPAASFSKLPVHTGPRPESIATSSVAALTSMPTRIGSSTFPPLRCILLPGPPTLHPRLPALWMQALGPQILRGIGEEGGGSF